MGPGSRLEDETSPPARELEVLSAWHPCRQAERLGAECNPPTSQNACRSVGNARAVWASLMQYILGYSL